jgi:hypothetical protein
MVTGSVKGSMDKDPPVNKKPMSRPTLGDLHHNYYWQAQENAPLRQASHLNPGFHMDVHSRPAQEQVSASIGAWLGARP